MTTSSRKFNRYSLALQFMLYVITVLAFFAILFDGDAELATFLFALLGLVQLIVAFYFLVTRKLDAKSKQRLKKYWLFVLGFFFITGLSIYIESNYSIFEDTFSNPFIPVEAIVMTFAAAIPLCLATYLLWVFKNATLPFKKKSHSSDVLDSDL